MVKEYLAELRRQGRIKGNLSIVMKDGKKLAKFPFKGT